MKTTLDQKKFAAIAAGTLSHSEMNAFIAGAEWAETEGRKQKTIDGCVINDSKSSMNSGTDGFRIIKRYLPVIGGWYYYLKRKETKKGWFLRKFMSWLFINYDDWNTLARTHNIQTVADWVTIYQCTVWEEHPISKQLSPISI